MITYNSSRRIFSTLLAVFFIILLFSLSAFGQGALRTEPRIPDIPGYVTLKCDFHLHTVFSDGNVWPTVRVDEAWRQGLDVLAITDHVEYQPHSKEVSTDLNKSYEIALPAAKSKGLMLLRGAEITRDMPPGHLNAIFLRDAGLLKTEKYKDSIKAAYDQGAFIFWNHPPFPQPEGKSVWYPEHEELYKDGWMHGIEVINGDSYFPEAHKWCIEKNLTMMCNSDSHDPMNLEYDLTGNNHRPMTLVFTKEKTEEALKEALFAHRTVVYSKDMLIGNAEFLKPIFNASIKLNNPDLTIKGDSEVNLQIRNMSGIPFELVADGESAVSYPKNVTLYPDKTVTLRVKGELAKLAGKSEVSLPYRVKNLLVAPGEGLPVKFIVKVDVKPSGQ